LGSRLPVVKQPTPLKVSNDNVSLFDSSAGGVAVSALYEWDFEAGKDWESGDDVNESAEEFLNDCVGGSRLSVDTSTNMGEDEFDLFG